MIRLQVCHDERLLWREASALVCSANLFRQTNRCGAGKNRSVGRKTGGLVMTSVAGFRHSSSDADQRSISSRKYLDFFPT